MPIYERPTKSFMTDWAKEPDTASEESVGGSRYELSGASAPSLGDRQQLQRYFFDGSRAR
jgi:hypothetical protein